MSGKPIQTYTYRGRSTNVNVPIINKDTLVEKYSFVILGTRYLRGMKTCGSPLLLKKNGSQLLDYHLDCIQSVCKDPDIVVIGGYQFEKLGRHPRRSQFKLVENIIYDLSNDLLDFRYGINAINNQKVFIVNSNFIPTINTYKILLNQIEQSQLLYHEAPEDTLNIGVHFSSAEIINSFNYSSKYKMSGLTYLAPKDTARLQRKVIGSSFLKTKFMYEAFDEVKLLGVPNTFNTYSINSKYDIDT